MCAVRSILIALLCAGPPMSYALPLLCYYYLNNILIALLCAGTKDK